MWFKKRFDAEGIGIAYPQRDVHLHLNDADKEEIITQLTADHFKASPASKEGADS
jgi:small-conductance mechanosensitive channel